MRITDLPVSTPATRVGATKDGAKRETTSTSSATVVTTSGTDSAGHPDEVAAAKLQAAAAAAQASRIVSAENQRASASVAGDFEHRVLTLP